MDGEDQLSGSYNKGKSEIGAFIWESYRNLHQWRYNTETFNYQDGTSFTRNENGEPDKLKYDNLYGNIYYNYKNGDKIYLNTTLNLGRDKSTINTKALCSQLMTGIIQWICLILTMKIRHVPWLDIYFQRNYNNNRTLIFNVVGTYIHNNIRRNYTEDKNSLVQTEINSMTRGNKYSVIAEAYLFFRAN